MIGRVATPQEVGPLAEVLARAFAEDPVHRWVFPKRAAWSRHSAPGFAVTMRAEVGHGTVFTTDRLEGAAIWRDPVLGPHTFLEEFRMALPMVWRLGLRCPRVFRGFLRLQALRPREPHWYLSVLGTDPGHQGRGVGAALLRPVLARCDMDRVAAYLEASRRENVPYYERHGFEVIDECALPKGPPVWRMLRRPPRLSD